jgi:hypothetical protein
MTSLSATRYAALNHPVEASWLQETVSEEKGYFLAEGLQYEPAS